MRRLSAWRVTALGAGLLLTTTSCSQNCGDGDDCPAVRMCALVVDDNFTECAEAPAALSDEQKLRADRLVSIFENDTIEIQYAYIEDIGDGRGYTAGRAGFTTATGDFLIVVERYAEQVPENALAAYLPRLTALAEQESASTSGLEGIVAVWTQTAEDPAFREVQDQVSDELYYERAVCWWSSLGLHRALSLVLLYDTNIQHGEGTDPDGLPAIIQRANTRAGGSPVDGVDEETWIRAFLNERQTSLASACDPATREDWAEAVPRALALRQLLDSDNWDFAGPIQFNQAPYTPVTIP